MKMDIPEGKNRPRFHKSAENLKSALLKAREILGMATVSPLSSSRLQTPSGSISDLSDCSQSSDYGYSALHGAVISHDLEYLDFLLSSGCELDQRDENGFTALHVGTLQKSVDGVQRLIDAGCNIEKLTKEGMSSLHIAVDLHDNDHVLTLLASSIPNINIKNKVGRTALHLSAKSGNQEYLKILLDAGCDRDIKDKFGFKAVDIARANHHGDCVQLLLYYVAQKRVFEKSIKDENINSGASSRNTDTNPCFLDERKKKLHETEIPTNDRNDLTNDKSNDTLPCVSSVVVLASSICKINLEKTNTTSVEDQEEPVLDLQLELSECAHTMQDDIDSHEHDQGMDGDYINSENNKLTAIFPELQYDGEMEMCSSRRISNENNMICHQKSAECVNASPSLDGHYNHEDRNTCVNSSLPCHPTNDTSCVSTSESTVSPLSFFHHQHTTTSTSQSIATSSKNVSRSPPITKALNPSNGMRAKPLHTSKLPPNGCHIYKSRSAADDMKDLHIVVTAISKFVKHEPDYSSSLMMKRKEYDDCKEELLSCMATIPLSLSSFQITQESLFYNYKAFMKDFTFNNFKTEKLNPNDILCKLLQGLKKTMNATTYNGHCKKTVENNLKIISPENRLNSLQLMEDKPGDFVELFLAASQDITVHREDACKKLDELCSHLYSQDVFYIRTLVDSIFTRTKLILNSITNEQTSLTNLVEIFLTLEYVIQQDKTPSFFASSAFENLLNTTIPLAPVVMTTRPEFVEFTIAKCLCVEESLWDENKIAQVFLFISHILVNSQSLMLKYTDVLLRAAFSCRHIDDLTLCSCILVRLGLLKSEFKINIFPHLKGPLLALTHVFAQDYFPAYLAGLFVSFLAKPRPRFRKVKEQHAQALTAAMLKEILDKNALLGKGLKRICDVLAHGEYWETAYQCCDVLFDASFCQHTRCTPMEQGSSILVYFGLIKSEFPIEAIKEIKIGLKLLQHSSGKIPEAIAPMLVIFLNKNKLYPYKEEVAQLVISLNK